MPNDEKPSPVDVLENNYPLRSRLRDKAPGTEKHCAAVTSLLLAVGSELKMSQETLRKLQIAGMNHDQGKTLAPEFFTENQGAPRGNPHDDLEPWMSHRIITAHVGATTAILINDENIPRDVVEWCSQHHGTTVLRYFSDLAETQAKEDGKGETINPDDYRYQATKPQSLEASLLMLCDICEAASRSKMQAQKLDRDDIPGLVESIYRNLEADGQFDEVLLRLGDLRTAREVIARELRALHHPRVDYDKAKETAKAKEDTEPEEK